MNSPTTVFSTTSSQGSVYAAQRLPNNAKPGKVEINRSVSIRARGPDGKSYSRTDIDRLLKVESGTEALSPVEETVLRDKGVSDSEIVNINRRLAELAGPAREHAAMVQMHEADTYIKAAVTIGADTKGALQFVMQKLTEGLLVLDDGGAYRGQSANAAPAAKTPHERLLKALTMFNEACKEAQTAYKELPKGSINDNLVLEFQKTWYSNQDLVNTLKSRECFYRPAGWSELRNQILSGQAYRKNAQAKFNKKNKHELAKVNIKACI